MKLPFSRLSLLGKRIRKPFQLLVVATFLVLIANVDQLITRTSTHYFPGSLLPGQTGVLSLESRIAQEGRDKPGFLTYGPYVRLTPGLYRIQFNYRSSSNVTGGWDIVFQGASRLLTQGPFLKTEHGFVNSEIVVSLNKSLVPLEIRSLYSGRGVLAVEGLTVRGPYIAWNMFLFRSLTVLLLAICTARLLRTRFLRDSLTRISDLGISPAALWKDFHSRLLNPTERRSHKRAGICVVLAVICTYNLVFFNRFLPLTEGWFSVYAVSILHGQMPYRDFYLLMPPLYPVQLAAFIRVFGQNIIALRILGIIVMLAMSLVLYLILARRFTAPISSLASIGAIIYYQSGNAHVSYDFTQFMTLYALLSVYFLIRAVELSHQIQPGNRRLCFSFFALSGFFAVLAFLTKQSNGSLIFASLSLALFVSVIDLKKRHLLEGLSFFFLGVLFPVVCTLYWLHSSHILGLFWHQVFSDAVEAKGSLGSILFAWTKGFLNITYITKVVKLFVLIAMLEYVGMASAKTVTKQRSAHSNLSLAGTALLALIAILLPLFDHTIADKCQHVFRLYLADGINIFSTATPLLLLSTHLPSLFSSGRKDFYLFIVVIASIGLIAGNGTSAGITEISQFLPLALGLCYVLSIPSAAFSLQLGAIVLSLVLMIGLSSAKYSRPYAWWHISEPDIRTERVCPDLDGLRGFYLSPTTAGIFSQVTSIIKAHAKPTDHIFAFPNIPIFYLLSDRWPATIGKVHWFDFLSDEKAIKDATVLLNSPPKVIVNLELPEDAWLTHELLFRTGKKMGQRKILDAIKTLTAQNYEIKMSTPVADDCVLRVWVKK